jgi:hypothetical protein
MRFIILIALTTGAVLASGVSGGSGLPAVGAEVRTLSETVPAGGTVQVKHLLTQPHPISSGGGSFSLGGMSVDGVAAFSPLGDTGGAAYVQNGNLYISIVSPSSDFGTNLDYPFLTITMDIPQSTAKGSSVPLGLSNLQFDSPSGPVLLTDPKPGFLTVGGSVSVRGVYPGGGTWPAGTQISVQGSGFQPGTKIATKMKTTNPVYVSPTEFRFALRETTTLDQQPLQVVNPDGSQVTYFSYLRGVLVQKPSRSLLEKTEPIFPALTTGFATLGPQPVLAQGQFTAVAIQNPTTAPVMVTFQLQSTGATGTILLPIGSRLMDELSALLGGASLAPGDIVKVFPTAGVQIIGLTCDEQAGTVTPFLPAN